ncbi:MAG TPA: TonB-dependent receptor [Desulfosalsimonadaceae bacterium]|nr:TonB-dependent receptor [Desulfosalsimonadaceae bacterium]
MGEQIAYMTRSLLPVVFLSAVFLWGTLAAAPAWAEEPVHDVGRVEITARGEDRHLYIEPQKETIVVEAYKSAAIPQNASDYLKDLPIMDYRGASDLVPDDDTLFMRGFSSKRFVTAINGATLRKSGGRRSSHIVDYALIPPFLIESVEVLPGPHSALYPAKSIGGVVNFKTSPPTRHETLKPDISVSTSYGSYATQNHNISLQGSAGDFTYDVGYQKYATNGYLRNHEADIDTFFGRFGILLPNNGHAALTLSYADADREIPVNNDPNDPESGYDGDYPRVSKASRFYDWQSPTWDKVAPYYRFHMKLPTLTGTWKVNAHYGEENRNYSMWEWADPSDHSRGIRDGSWETEWHQQGGKITNTFRLGQGHVTTVGAELEQLYDGYGDIPGWGGSSIAHDDKKRIETLSGFAQHEWEIIPRLKLKAGLRYEDDTIWVSNHSSSSGQIYITGRGMWIERSWSEWMPKSFLTYELDELAEGLRDTSVSVGISRIWHAPDYHGIYNPQGRPTGAWLDPEHGVGYDLILNRRIAGNIEMKLSYAYYEIEDYISYNRSYADFWPRGGNQVEPGMEYKDYMINLDEVVRQGIELQVNGNITDNIGFAAGYAWQDFENQGDEPAGKTELDNRPENRVTAKLTYQLFDPTCLILDYEYQDEQVTKKSEEIAPDVYRFDEIAIDSFHVFDFAVEQSLFDQWKGIHNGMLKIYVKNLFNEEYQNTSGYPATDRTVGAGISFQM